MARRRLLARLVAFVVALVVAMLACRRERETIRAEPVPSGTALPAAPTTVVRAYVARASDGGLPVAHVVTSDGLDHAVPDAHAALAVVVAADARTVVVFYGEDLGAETGAPLIVSTRLVVLRDGVVRATIEGAPFVREWSLRLAPCEVAVEVGGLHFAGQYQRHSCESGKELERVDETDLDGGAPPWATALDALPDLH